MKLHAIDTGLFKLDGGAMFGVVPKVLWKKINPPDENNLCTWAMRCLLIDSGERTILIDTGIGEKQDERFRSHFHPHGEDSLKGSLEAAGYSQKKITDVLLTHLHFDHCGGAVDKNSSGALTPTFPNATYWSNKTHWLSAMYPNKRENASFLKENFVPLQEAEQLSFLEDGAELAPGVKVHYVYGHTNAMMLVEIEARAKTILYMADLIPSAGHVSLPYVMAYDMEPRKTLDEKAKFLEYAFQKNAILFFEHDPKIECCTLKKTAKGYRVDKTGKLNELLKI